MTVIYNLKSMQVLIKNEQRYYSARERYMKNPGFAELNAAGFLVLLTCRKRTEVTLHSFTLTEGAADFELTPQRDMPDAILSNIELRRSDKPAYPTRFTLAAIS